MNSLSILKTVVFSTYKLVGKNALLRLSIFLIRFRATCHSLAFFSFDSLIFLFISRQAGSLHSSPVLLTGLSTPSLPQGFGLSAASLIFVDRTVCFSTRSFIKFSIVQCNEDSCSQTTSCGIGGRLSLTYLFSFLISTRGFVV